MFNTESGIEERVLYTLRRATHEQLTAAAEAKIKVFIKRKEKRNKVFDYIKNK